MVHVAKEMRRTGCTVPLLIGGATTSAAHTAVKIAPEYPPGVVHVLDASRVVNVVSSLLSPENKPAFMAEVAREAGEAARGVRGAPRRASRCCPWRPRGTAGRRSTGRTVDIPRPEFLGAQVHKAVPLEEIVPFIDWGPFFSAWELHGRYPDILKDPVVGPEATKLHDDAVKLLARIVEEKRFTANAVIGFWPCNSVGDDIEVYADEARSAVATTFHMLRQQLEKPADQFNHCLADYIAPRESGRIDYIGGFAVTAGHGVEKFAAEFRAASDDYNAIMSQALGDRLAEAMAEMFHKRAREACGFGRQENLSHADLIRERYRGIRPAPGYPACPDHTEKPILFQHLGRRGRHRHQADRELRDDPGEQRQRLVPKPSRLQILRRGQARARPGEDYAKRKGWTTDVGREVAWALPRL